jgi:hypothetical protein
MAVGGSDPGFVEKRVSVICSQRRKGHAVFGPGRCQFFLLVSPSIYESYQPASYSVSQGLRLGNPGKPAKSFSQPSAVLRSAATPCTRPPNSCIAVSTRFCVRPLIHTAAPSAAKDLAIANPIPAVEAVTKARLLYRPKFIPGKYAVPVRSDCRILQKSLLRCFSKLSYVRST